MAQRPGAELRRRKTDVPRSDDFVGRDFELRMVDEAFDALGLGEPHVVQIFGEPGVGKTRLNAEIVKRARARGYTTLQGHGTEYEREVPFAALVAALDPLLEELGPREFARLGDERIAELARVFPSLDASGQTGTVAGFGERYLLHRAVSQLVALVAEARPLVLVIDDLHWVDSASVELIMHLLDRGLDGDVLLLLAYRRPSIKPELASCLDAHLRRGSTTRLELKPLNRRQATQLCPQLDSEQIDRIYRESGGNPFYLEQLSRSHQLGDGDAELADVSILVRAAIEREIEALDPAARVVVDSAAVAGEEFDPELLASIARMPEWQVLELIDLLVEHDLLRPADGREFRFRHPIVRRCVYESVGSGWRLGAHARAAAELERRGAPVTTLAHHVERGARVGDVEAATLLARAGQAAAARAPGIAAGWFDAALRLLPADAGHGSQRLEWRATRAIALGAAGELHEARDVLHSVLDDMPPDNSALRIEVTRFVAVFEMLTADHRNARRLLVDALAQLEDHNSPEAIALMSELASVAYFSVDVEQLVTWAERTLEACGTNEPINVATIGMLAHGRFARGEVEQVRRLTTDAGTRLDALSDEQIAARPDCALWVGVSELLLEDLPAAHRHFERGIRVARSFGQGHFVMLALAGHAWTLARMGRLAEASSRAQEACESGALVGNVAAIKAGLSIQSATMLWCGTLDEAVSLAEQAYELTKQITGPYDEAAIVALGEALLERGEVHAAHDLLRQPESVELERRIAPVEYHRLELLTRANVELGDLEAADRYAQEVERLAAERGLAGWSCEAHRARAVVFAAHGDTAAAAEQAELAVERIRGIGLDLETAKSEALAGSLRVATGDERRGRELLERAERGFASIGAWRGRDRVLAQLRKLGVHRTNRFQRQAGGAEQLAGLTARELQVAEMLPAGKTNREIAEELSLSVRTVERHVANVFAKLGVSSRAAVASLVERSRG